MMLSCKRNLAIVVLVAGFLPVGCRSVSTAERFGKTFFLDGAGNWGNGGRDVARGLFAAGYEGDVEEYVWTTSFNPLIDQLNTVGAKVRALALARKITRYRRQYPNNKINMVALSAGTGVAIWALEHLPENVMIENLVLLGSSLSHDYDVSKALVHMSGYVYVYYSPHDSVLEHVRVIGTIDGRRGVDSVGYVGLTPPVGSEDRVVNIGWSQRWLKYGWAGAHSDTTNPQFVRHEIARHIIASPDVLPSHPDHASKTVLVN